MMTVSHVEIDGGTLAVEIVGDGPLVICSPGMGDTRDAYAPLATYLAANGFRVASVDLRGHGDSSATFSRYGDEAIADDVIAVIGALGGEPAILVGASMSAGAAVIAAGRDPELVDGIVLIGPFLRNSMSRLMRNVLHIALAWPWGPAVWRSSAAKLWPGLGEAAKQRAARSTRMLAQPGRWRAFHATSATDHGVVAPWLGKAEAPALVIMGSADPDWTDPVTEAAWVASNFADGTTIIVDGAGHAPMLERPSTVNLDILRFVTQSTGSIANDATLSR